MTSRTNLTTLIADHPAHQEVLSRLHKPDTIMPRRGKKRQQDFDDSLEQSYFAKRSGSTTGNDDDKKDDAPDDDAKLERLRAKKMRRKERKKQKAEDRLQYQQDLKQERRDQAAELNEKRKEQKVRKETKKSVEGEWTKTRKGVQYQDTITGHGPEVRTSRQIQVKYTLRAKPGGRIIDSSSNFGTFLGKGEVIVGWDIGMEGMRQGGVRQLIVPPQAGYGQKDVGAGVGALLYFEIKLLAC